MKLAGASAAATMLALIGPLAAQTSRRVSAVSAGATGDGVALNTAKIQAAIDKLAASGGGTLVLPQGVFLSGAIFLKPGVNLHLEPGAVLKGSTNTADYPKRMTRVEGHFEEWLPALLNADGCHGLRITGSGTLDGSGAPFWKAFWDARAKDNKTKNLDVPRPRLALIENSKDVQLSGLTFKDSGFWNLHMYRCQHVLIENMSFQVPDNQRCPSTDGTDIDSCQYVTIRGCSYRVDDDCVCLKGSKGPAAMDDKDSPAVEHIRIENCTYYRGGGIVTLGSEATIVRDVVVENCTIKGKVNVLRLKLRPDTPQLYEDVHLRNITLEGGGAQIVNCAPWKQYFDLQGAAPPKSTVRNVTFENIKGHGSAFGQLAGNAGQSTISDITFKDIDVQLDSPKLMAERGINIAIQNVVINGKPYEMAPG
ncbi:glycoside hydrolase family 28 protein [Granulicella rosea]|uniref:glycoside hydrolase family 28 protein n=1 Tax=Granulicella rosea TaxID=474952 RepID=UPI00159538FB|nr:glycosyl hydrolase family 28 protein [Granulicella rosea]